jgi:hypothetical protein
MAVMPSPGCGRRSSVGAVSVAAPALAGATVRRAGRELLVLGGMVTAVLLGAAAGYGPHRVHTPMTNGTLFLVCQKTAVPPGETCAATLPRSL